ncbi:MFS family permease [Methylobacterium sp. BE186]|uniref:MFS transporter n=1 Tax=Methylobacterium sp. BE186 TaxID=2817715 RepID=UPI00285801A9|nr:MFS transporter [Methylobacterium sp. BE186]MDR7040658.1 MFS family permease [Methylobacterium sp. BE186]
MSAAADARDARIRLACCLGMLAVGVNGTAIMAALPTMRADLALGPEEVTWAVNSYLLMSAACIILGGKASDWIGAQRVALVGLLLFGVASAAIAAATGPGLLLAGRAVQGLGAALAVPATLSCIGQAADLSRRATALSAWAGTLMLGFSLGPLVGGALTHAIGWRSVFGCTAVALIAAAILLLTARTGEETPASRRPSQIDAGGFLLLAVLMVSVILTLNGLPRVAQAPIHVALPFAAAAAASILFVRVERRSADPFVDLAQVRRSPLFLRAAAIGAVTMFCILSTLLYFNVDAQGTTGLQLSPIGAGLVLLPLSMGLFASSRLAPRVVRRLGPASALGSALIVVAVACAVIAAAAHHRSEGTLCAGLFLFGAGLAVPYATAPRLALSALPPEAAGQSSGLINACTFLGGSFGVTSGAILYPLAGFSGVMTLVAAAALIGATLARSLPRAGAR